MYVICIIYADDTAHGSSVRVSWNPQSEKNNK